MSHPIGDDPVEMLHVVIEKIYGRLRELASFHMGGRGRRHTLQPTAVANEVVLRLLKNPERRWEGEAHITATASRAVRQILIDHARGKNSKKRGGGRSRVPLDAVVESFEDRSADLVDLSAAIDRLASLEPDAATIVEFRFFMGMTLEQIATLLGVPKRKVERDWVTARAWLSKELGPRE